MLAETLELEIQTRAGLGEVAAALAHAPQAIAYYGASVTAQKEGYRPRLHEWFTQHFGQPHRMITAGAGAFASDAAVFLLNELVLQYSPTFCLVEFTTSDMGLSTPPASVGEAVEGMVIQLRAAGCTPCLLYLYRHDQTFNETNPYILAYERVAAHYHIPSIHVGRAMAAVVARGSGTAQALTRDGIHLTPQGADLTAALIGRALEQLFNHSSLSPSPEVPLYAHNFAHTEMIAAAPGMLREPTNCIIRRFHLALPFIEIDASNEFQIVSEGELAGLLVIIGPEAGIVRVSTPQQTRELVLFDQWSSYDRLGALMFRFVIPPGTPVQIQLSSRAVDYSVCPAVAAAPPPETKLKVVRLLVRHDP